MINYIIDFFSVLPTFVMCLISYRIITSEKFKMKLSKIISIVIITLCSLTIRYSNITLLIVFSNIFFVFLTIKFNYKINIKKTIYYGIVTSIISLFADALIPFIINNSYLLNFEMFQKNYIYRELLNFPVCLIIILFSWFPFLRKIINVFYEKYISKIKFNKITLLFLIAVISIIIIYFCFNAYNESNKIVHFIMILGIFCFTLLFIVTLSLLYREYQIKILNDNIMEENKYIQKIAKQDEEFKHNVINNLLGIKTVASKKVNILIDDLIKNYQNEYTNLTNINDLPNGIQSIIYRKAYNENIDNLNLVVNNNLKNELYNMLTARNYNNLCTAIGILFDNALDAIKDRKNKIVEITFEENNTQILVIIKNSFSNIIDIDEIGKKNYTTKRIGHGIGINYIMRMKNIEVKNEIINSMFITKLKIRKIKKYIK